MRELLCPRIDGNDQPICRVYAISSDQVVKSVELLNALNSINSRHIFLRTPWVSGQLLIEGRFLALTMDPEGFETLCLKSATDTDTLGDPLLEQFGGRPRFKDSQDNSYLSVRRRIQLTLFIRECVHSHHCLVLMQRNDLVGIGLVNT